MSFSEISTLLSLLTAGGYTLLLASAYARRRQMPALSRYLLAYFMVSIAWELARINTAFPHLPLRPEQSLLLVNSLLLGLITAVYLDWPYQRRWLIFGGSTIALLLVIKIAIPLLTPLTLGFVETQLVTIAVWAGFNGILLAITRRNYYQAHLPWHANRLLYWLLVLLLIVGGELILFIRLSGLVVPGQVLRFLGGMGLAYAAVSHRIFDVRARGQRAISFILVTVLSSLPLIIAILLIELSLPILSSQVALLLTGLAIVTSFILYQPFRRFIERLIYRYVTGRDTDTNAVVRRYSQAIYKILDVRQLSEVTLRMISEVLDTEHGALLTVSPNGEGCEVQLYPGLGPLTAVTTILPAQSAFLSSLQAQHQALLQYEIDFNPDFASISETEREWLQTMDMDVYVPVSTGEDLVGLLALGPKKKGSPYQPHELSLVQLLADQTVIALQNARLYSELSLQNDRVRQLNLDLVAQNERLEIMDKVKADFITIASHELRTPLTQVKGYSDILSAMNESKALTPKQTQEILGHIDRATDRLEGLITAMLDASQIDAEGIKLAYMPTTLESVVSIALDPLQTAVRERRLTVVTEGLEDLPTLKADFKRLVQAFRNLIGNALKYTPDHGRITVRGQTVVDMEGDADHIEVVIADTGIGINPEYHELIFEKFFRIGDPKLHSTGTTKFKGAGPGLGLPIAKGVIEAHAGRIWVESEGEDEAHLPGSRFHIILPITPPDYEAAPAPTTDAKQEEERPSWLIG